MTQKRTEPPEQSKERLALPRVQRKKGSDLLSDPQANTIPLKERKNCLLSSFCQLKP